MPEPDAVNFEASRPENLLASKYGLEKSTGFDLPVDDEILAIERDLAESTGKTATKSTGAEEMDLPVEFFYGKTVKHGRTIKTGKVYWIFVERSNGRRRRISPTKIYGPVKGITSIEKCPFRGRVEEFYIRSLAVGTADHDAYDPVEGLSSPSGSGAG